MRASGIIAPFVLDGPMTGEAFRASVEQVLAPELEPGDAVVMDTLSPHKVAGVHEAIRAAGASVLYLPSYSPDFNPIEHLFAKLKELLRKAAARTKEALWDAIGQHLERFRFRQNHTKERALRWKTSTGSVKVGIALVPRHRGFDGFGMA